MPPERYPIWRRDWRRLCAHGACALYLSGSALSGLTPDSSVRESYTRTQALARYYCRLYGNITLVLDVRRSAETVGNERLATYGTVRGQSAAQARFIVDALRRGAQPGRLRDRFGAGDCLAAGAVFRVSDSCTPGVSAGIARADTDRTLRHRVRRRVPVTLPSDAGAWRIRQHVFRSGMPARLCECGACRRAVRDMTDCRDIQTRKKGSDIFIRSFFVQSRL